MRCLESEDYLGSEMMIFCSGTLCRIAIAELNWQRSMFVDFSM